MRDGFGRNLESGNGSLTLSLLLLKEKQVMEMSVLDLVNVFFRNGPLNPLLNFVGG